MIPDILSEATISVGTPAVDGINALWSHVDVNLFIQAVSWFDRLNEWLPISDMAIMIAISVTLGVVAQGIKWGVKAIELLPFAA